MEARETCSDNNQRQKWLAAALDWLADMQLLAAAVMAGWREAEKSETNYSAISELSGQTIPENGAICFFFVTPTLSEHIEAA